jgi:hypothetical protein
MALKPVLTKTEVEALPDVLRREYVDKGDKFELALDGVPPGFHPATDVADLNTKLVEFRNNNISLKQQIDALTPIKAERDALMEKFKDIDADAARDALAKLKKLGDKGVKDESDIQRAIEAALSPLKGTITDLQTKLTDAEKRDRQNAIELSRKDFQAQVTTLGAKAGVDEKMLGPFVKHVLDTFQFDEESKAFVPKTNGAPVFSKKNGNVAMPLEEFIELSQVEVPGFFKQSRGAATPPNPGAGGGHNPNQRVLINPTPQQLGDPKIAEQMKKGELRIEHTATPAA